MIHYCQISRRGTTLLLDWENNIVLLSQLHLQGSSELNNFVNRLVEDFILSIQRLVLIEYLPDTNGWKLARLDQKAHLPTIWEDVSEEDIKRVLICHSSDKRMLSSKVVETLLKIASQCTS